MYRPHGIITAMVTPFTEDEKLNEKELRRQVNRLINAGVHGLFCLGTNGEFYALDMEEKIEVIKIVIDENKGRLPVSAGTGCVTTRETVRLSQKAQELGVDAVSVITPYFVQISQDELYNHYKAVAESVSIPVILYNIPMRTGINIDPSTVAKLSRIPNIIGIKDSSGNYENTLKYIQDTDDDFIVLSGNDSLILWTLMAGGTGGISGLSNLFPGLLASIYEYWRQGKIEEARKAQDSLRAIREAMKYGNPNTIVKRAMNLLGHSVGPARMPVPGDSAKLDPILTDILKQYEQYKN